MTPEEERKLAVTLFNRVWELMETDPRTPEENDELIHAAHASRYHWGNVGEPANSARGEWQCSRIYTVLGRADAAFWHAQRCLEICTQHGIGDWDLAYAYEALARTHALAGETDESGRFLELARGVEIAEEDDREHLLDDLKSIGQRTKTAATPRVIKTPASENAASERAHVHPCTVRTPITISATLHARNAASTPWKTWSPFPASAPPVRKTSLP